MALDIGTLTGAVAIEDQVSNVLNTIISNVEQFASKFEGALGVVAVGAGVAATAIAGVTAAVTALGSRGADIDDVAGSLDQFSGSAENAAKIMDALRSGTHNTINDFDLMKSSSKLLAAGVKLTADDFGTLSKAAFALQNQGFGTTREVLERLNMALLTGRTRTLQFMGVTVDLEKAETTYAATLGKKRSELDALQKKEADRQAMLEALIGTVQRAGQQEEDFNDILDQLRVGVKNWFDELARGVSGSPVVMKAFRDIQSALVSAFGSGSQTLLEVAITGIEKFSRFIADATPYVLKITEAVSDFFKVIWDNRGTIEIILGVAAALKGWSLAQTAVTSLTTAIGLAGTAATTAAGSAASGVGVAGLIALLTSPVGAAILAGAALGGAVVILGNRLDRYRQQLHDAIEESKKAMPLEHVPWTRDPSKPYIDPKKAQEIAAAQTGPLVATWPGGASAKAGGGASAVVPTKEQLAREAELQKIQDSLFGTDAIKKAEDYASQLGNVGNVSKLTADKQKELRAAIQAGIDAADAAGKKIPEDWQAIIAATEDLYSAAAGMSDAVKQTGDVLGRQLSQLKIQVTQLAIEASNGADRLGGLGENMVPGLTKAQLEAAGVTGTIVEGGKKSTKALDETAEACGGLARSFEMLSNIAGGKLGSVAQAIGNIFGGMEVGKKAGQGLRESIDEFSSKDVLGSISNVATNIMGIVGALDAATSSSNHFANALGGAMAGAQAGSAFGPWGAAIGAIGGGLFGALRGIGGPSKEELAGRQSTDQFTDSLKGALSAAERLEVAQLIGQGGSAKWANQIVGLRHRYEEAGFSLEEANAKAAASYDMLFRAEVQGGEAVGAAIAGIEAEIEALTGANQEAADAARKAKEEADASADRVQSLVDAFSGKDAAQAANEMVEAISRIGGAAKLTQSEQERANQTVMEAIDQYRVLGLEVPQSWLDIAAATDAATRSTEKAVAEVGRYIQKIEDANSLAGQVLDAFGNPIPKQIIDQWLLDNPGDWRRIRQALSNWTDPNAPEGWSFAGGTPGLGFVNFGAGRLVQLHGEEAVVPEGRAGEFAARHGGWDDTALRREIVGMRSDISRLFEQLPIHFRDAAQSVVLRR